MGAAVLFCPVCRLPARALRLEPRPPAPTPLPLAVTGGNAVCFFHPENPAARACETCGRFVCSLCDLELDGRHSCPACFVPGTQATAERPGDGFRPSDTLYDSMAMAAGFGWILFYPAWLFAFGAVVYWTIAKGNLPKHYVVPRRGWRFLAAMAGVLGLPMVLLGGVLLIGRMVAHR